MLFTLIIVRVAVSAVNTGAVIILVYFTCAVCEARLGVGLLISLSRKTGNELVRALV